MNVTLSSKWEAVVRQQVSSGRYASATDVVQEALRRLDEKDDEESPELEAAVLAGLRSDHREFGPATLTAVRQSAGGLK